MNKKGMQIATSILLAGTITISGLAAPAEVQGMLIGLPSAGAANALGEGISLEMVSGQGKEPEIEGLEKAVEDAVEAAELPIILAAGAAREVELPVAVNEDALVREEQDGDQNAVTPEEGEPEGTPDAGNEDVGEQPDEADSENAGEQPNETEQGADENVEAPAQEQQPEDFTNLVVAQVNNFVNVRSMPSEEGEVIGKLYNESVGEFISQTEDGWYQIKSGQCEGYVKAEYVVTDDAAMALVPQVGKRIATVSADTLRVRTEPSTEASVVTLIPGQDEVRVLEEVPDWVKVSTPDGEGYVSAEFVTLRTEFVKAESREEEEARLAKEAEERAKAEAKRKAEQEAARRAQGQGQRVAQGSAQPSGSSAPAPVAPAGSATGENVASFATQFVGNPYVSGGSSLTNGADCSGFVMAVYANFGVGLPHSSAAMRSVGVDVGGLGNAAPGDIVCYSGHVAIYIGGGQIVHASTHATGIKISNAGYKAPITVRRVV